jgi:Tol biopolymer transport system component
MQHTRSYARASERVIGRRGQRTRATTLRTRALALPGVVLLAWLALAGPLALPALARDETHGSVLVWEQFATDFSSAHVAIADGAGRRARALTSPPSGFYDMGPELSPDGREVLLERGGGDGSEILLVNVHDGRARVVPTGCTDPCADDIVPSWGPDGHQLLFTRIVGPFDPQTGNAVSAVLYSEDLHGGGLRRVSEPGIDGAFEEYRPRFAPDGRSMVMVRIDNATGHAAVFRMDASGGPARQLTDWTLDGDDPDFSPARSGPTKNLVVFETNSGPMPGFRSTDLATVPAFCGPPAACTAATRTLTDNAASGTSSGGPSWSPDGSRIAFVNVPPSPDSPDVLTIKADGSDRRHITNSPEFELTPDWGRGGLFG